MIREGVGLLLELIAAAVIVIVIMPTYLIRLLLRFVFKINNNY